MWNSEENINGKMLETFRKLGPLIIDKVTEHLDYDFLTFDEEVYEYREKEIDGVIYQGQYNKIKNCFEGIMRKKCSQPPNPTFYEIADFIRDSHFHMNHLSRQIFFCG